MNDKSQARDKLEEILNQSEYQVYYEDNRNFLQQWWDHAKSWLADKFNNWFGSLEQSTAFAEGMLVIVVLVVLVLLGVAIYYIARTYQQKQKFHHKPLQSNDQMHWSFRDHLTEADHQEKSDNFALATRHLFLALLLYSDQKEWLQARIWKTNWEYYAELRHVDKKKADQFYHLALLFEQVTYGDRMMQDKEYSDYRKKVTEWINGTKDQSSQNG